MADDDKNTNTDTGGKPNNNTDVDTSALKSALDKERQRAQEAENQVKALRVELGTLKQKDDASKSELDKLKDRVEAAEKKQVDSEARSLRIEVAQAKGLTADQAKRLTGSTKEELEADAEDVVKAFGLDKQTDDTEAGKASGQPNQAPRSRPTELREGSGAAGAEPEDMRKVADEILGGR